jgi:thiamine pyrophosphate-dependent acetolactate synthase large subunit-like protein
MDFAAIAEGMGCLGLNANSAESLTDALRMAENSGKTAVINVSIDPASTHINISDY